MGQNGSVRLLEKIGEGSFAEVYKAKWNGRLVAAKRLHTILFRYDCGNENGVVARFLEESRVLRELRHPNIVELLDIITKDGEPPIIVTELLECDLAELVEKSQSDPKVATENVLHIMLDVSKGLEYLHGQKRPLIHRDIAPKNILVYNEKHAKIADVGLAKLAERLYLSPVPGTQAYMAPETYFSCNTLTMVKYGIEIDIYSLGVTMLEVIIGKPIQMLSNPLADDIVSPSHIGHRRALDEIGEDHPLKKLVTRCLEEDPLDRPTAAEIIKQLEEPGLIKDIVRFDLWRSINQLQEEFLQWIPIRRRTVRELQELNLEDMAARLDEHHRNINIATAAGATTSIVASGVAVAGFISSFFTFGATIPIAIAGGVVGAAGGLTTFGSKMTEVALTKLASDKVSNVLAEDQAACTAIRNRMSQLDDLITKNVLKIRDVVDSRKTAEVHKLEEVVKLFEKITGVALRKTDQLEPVKGGTRGVSAVVGVATSCTTAGIATARVGTSVAFDSLSAVARATHITGFVVSILAVPFDIYFLVKSSKELIDGKPSDVAERIRSIQSRLVFPEENEIESIVQAYVRDKVTEIARKEGIAVEKHDVDWVLVEKDPNNIDVCTANDNAAVEP